MGRKKKGIDVDGWVIIDKPTGIGSTPVVGKVRRGFNANKVGHAGTLDPFATGVLPIALGMATKTIPFIQDADKEYIMTLQFGTDTDSLDTQGAVVQVNDVRPSVGQILDAIPHFLGRVEQIPPAYSAIKIGGKRAYDLARAGGAVDMPSRTVRIDSIDIVKIHDSQGSFHMDMDMDWHTMRDMVCDSIVLCVGCGKGTYMRTLGRDIARKCGCLGYLTALRRTKVGAFTEKESISLANFEKIGDNSIQTDDYLLSVESSLVGIPVLTVSGQDATRFQTGIRISCPARVDIPHMVPLVIATKTHILGLATTDGVCIKSTRVFYKPVPRRKI